MNPPSLLDPKTSQTSFCHICGCDNLKVFESGSAYVRVTSDCKPWPARSYLAICSDCKTIQTVITPEWREQVLEIYREYQVYHQAAGIEQVVFSDSGESHSRSSRLVANLAALAGLSRAGHALDIGCGNGSFLAAFKNIYSAWKISGAEFDDKHEPDLAALPGFQKLYTGGLDKIGDRFDFVSLVHTLEHIENPLPFLNIARSLLTPGGLLFIQVPHYRENPFELMTFDHATHFDVCTLTNLLRRVGLEPIQVATDWVSKEISVLASPSQQGGSSVVAAGWEIQACLEWLETLIGKAKAAQARSESFGIFGSSIAATFTAANLPRLPDFFVDEDFSRVGRSHMARKIIDTDSIPAASDIFVALQPSIQNRILARYHANSNCSWLGC